MKKLFEGIGHGGNDPGAECFGMVEKDINLVIGLSMNKEILATGLIETKLSRYKDENDNLNEEIRECNEYNPDLAIDIHTNAGGGDGFEVFYSNGSENGYKFAKLIEEEVKAMGQNSRGVKIKLTSTGGDYFGFVRETKAPAVIVECGFLDSDDRFIFDTKEEQELFGKAYARAVLRYFGYNPDEINTEESDNIDKVEKEPVIQEGECKLLKQAKNNVIVYGSKSNYVLMLQTMLLNLGYNPNGVDGHCGNGMVAAIKQYQRDNGLVADGSCGPATWTHIFNN